MSNRIKVLLVDDHAVVRQGYRRLIEMHSDIEVVAEAEDASSGYQAFKLCKPDRNFSPNLAAIPKPAA